MRDVPVLAQPLRPGDVIGPQDIEWAEARASRIGAGVVTDPAGLVGFEARRFLRAGEPVRVSDLRPPLLVHKGGLVTLSYATPTMRLTLVGRALADGAKGDVVRVLNIQSSRVIEAAIDGTDSASVRGPAPLAAN